MAKRTGSVSAAIRAYLADHPNEKTGAIAAAVSKQVGREVKPNYVSMVKSQGKKRRRSAGARGRKRAVSSAGITANGSGSLETLRHAIAFSKECGGVRNAIALLTELEGISA